MDLQLPGWAAQVLLRPRMGSRKTKGERNRAILGIGLPIVGAMVSQNVLNLVDTGMVGRLGDTALAAVGAGSFANFLAIAFITGLSTGVQAMVARRVGEGRTSDLAVPLNGALIMALATALPASVVLYWSAPALFPFLNDDPAVVEVGTKYLQARLLAMVAVGMNFSFRGFWNAIEQSQVYLRTLLVMHAVNIFLNWVLIYGHLGAPALGAQGAGLGSAISTYVGTVTYFLIGFRRARSEGFLAYLPDAQTLRTMLRLAIPTGLQQLSFAGGFTCLFWIIGQVGTKEAAAAHVVISLMLVIVLPGLAFGMAAASLVGQALGRGEPDDARRWGWDVVRVASVVMSGLGLVLFLFPDPVLSVFLHDAATLEVARGPLRLVGATVLFDSVGMVLQHALLGAGATSTVMRVSLLTQWGFFLPSAYMVGPWLGYGLTGIWLMQVVYRGLQAALYVLFWRRSRWAQIRL